MEIVDATSLAGSRRVPRAGRHRAEHRRRALEGSAVQTFGRPDGEQGCLMTRVADHRPIHTRLTAVLLFSTGLALDRPFSGK